MAAKHISVLKHRHIRECISGNRAIERRMPGNDANIWPTTSFIANVHKRKVGSDEFPFECSSFYAGPKDTLETHVGIEFFDQSCVVIPWHDDDLLTLS